MTTNKQPKEKPKGKIEMNRAPAADAEKSEAMARLALRPSINAAAVVSLYANSLGTTDDDLAALTGQLAEYVQEVSTGDLKRAEAMLFGQAHALQAIFMSLARRATTQDYLKQWEAYLRMALKAQNQCRMTLETLATIKNPPVVFARQANINNGGQQQVNNGGQGVSAPVRAGAHAQAPAGNPQIDRTELMEASDGERLDTGAASTTGGADSHLEAMGAVHRPAHR